MHNEQNVDWVYELMIMTISSGVYGAVNTIVGHPLDTVKTKMQTQKGYEESTMKAISNLWKKEGLLGFYRGVIPPLWGSAVYRSLQFSVYQAHYSYCEQHKLEYLNQEIPYTNGLQVRVITGSILGGSVRSIVECPVEVAKVKRQTGQNWQYKDLLMGFKPLYIRTVLLLVIYIVQFDYLKRKTDLIKHSLGQFVASGFCAVNAFVAIWPLEVIKNQIQSGKLNQNTPLLQSFRNIGFKGLLRGLIPGSYSVFFRNGAAMLALQKCQEFSTTIGIRH